MSSEKPKKKWYKKWWVWVIVIVMIGSVFNQNDDDATKGGKDNTPPTVQQDQTNDKQDENTDDSTEDNSGEADETPEAQLTFELVAGEAGEYGELFTINKDTEFEETYYIYRIPAGTYTITNTGSYMAQLSVYGNEIVVNDAGWEEPAETLYVKLLDVGASDTVTIPEDCFIEIHEPDQFTFELNK